MFSKIKLCLLQNEKMCIVTPVDIEYASAASHSICTMYMYMLAAKYLYTGCVRPHEMDLSSFQISPLPFPKKQWQASIMCIMLCGYCNQNKCVYIYRILSSLSAYSPI